MANPVPPNAPSKKPGQPSGGGRGNNPPKGKLGGRRFALCNFAGDAARFEKAEAHARSTLGSVPTIGRSNTSGCEALPAELLAEVGA